MKKCSIFGAAQVIVIVSEIVRGPWVALFPQLGPTQQSGASDVIPNAPYDILWHFKSNIGYLYLELALSLLWDRKLKHLERYIYAFRKPFGFYNSACKYFFFFDGYLKIFYLIKYLIYLLNLFFIKKQFMAICNVRLSVFHISLRCCYEVVGFLEHQRIY